MKRLLPLILLVLVPAPSAALADGCPPVSCGLTSSAAPGSRLLLVRPMGQQGPLRAVDLLTGASRFSLSAGLLSADGTTFVSSARQTAARTQVERYDARTGKLQGSWAMHGRWSVSGLTANGRQVVVTHYRKHELVIGVADSRVRVRRTLRGSFDVEAVSPEGRRVFLVHYTGNGYKLEQLDVASRTLSATRLAESDERMSGSPVTAVATRAGHWLLTLYEKDDGGTFVHALDLRTGVAHCIDLPLTGDFITVGTTTLTLSPDERRLYLASPLLGRVMTVDLKNLRLSRSVRFRAAPPSGNGSIGPSGAITPNGRVLAFTDGSNRMWLYDTAFGILHRRMQTNSVISGIGFRPNGRQLLAIATGRVLAFDAATGAPLG